MIALNHNPISEIFVTVEHLRNIFEPTEAPQTGLTKYCLFIGSSVRDNWHGLAFFELYWQSVLIQYIYYVYIS